MKPASNCDHWFINSAFVWFTYSTISCQLPRQAAFNCGAIIGKWTPIYISEIIFLSAIHRIIFLPKKYILWKIFCDIEKNKSAMFTLPTVPEQLPADHVSNSAATAAAALNPPASAGATASVGPVAANATNSNSNSNSTSGGSASAGYSSKKKASYSSYKVGYQAKTI